MRLIILILIVSIFFESCDDSTSCGDVACTEIFVIVDVPIEDMEGNPVRIDSSKTYNEAENVIFEVSKAEIEDNQTRFSIVTDQQIAFIKKTGSKLTFKAWQEGVEAVSEEFLIGADCCHIHKIEGPDKIVLP